MPTMPIFLPTGLPALIARRSPQQSNIPRQVSEAPCEALGGHLGLGARVASYETIKQQCFGISRLQCDPADAAFLGKFMDQTVAQLASAHHRETLHPPR